MRDEVIARSVASVDFWVRVVSRSPVVGVFRSCLEISNLLFLNEETNFGGERRKELVKYI